LRKVSYPGEDEELVRSGIKQLLQQQQQTSDSQFNTPAD